MKKYKAFLIAAVLIAALAALTACGGGKDVPNNTPATPANNTSSTPDMNKVVVTGEPGHGTEDYILSL